MKERVPTNGADPELTSFLGFEEFKSIGSPSEHACVAIQQTFTATSRRVHVRQQGNEIDEVQPSAASGHCPAVSPACPGSLKRKLEPSSLTSNKKLRLDVKGGIASPNPKHFDGRVQFDAYTLEMFSQNPGVQHMINLLHVGELCSLSLAISDGLLDDCLFIWYFDREGIVRSDGISFIAHFPRVLMLMALCQRFTHETWGQNGTFNYPPISS